MKKLQRINTNNRMSQIVVYGDTASLAGITAPDSSLDIRGQTRQVLERIDALLKQVGTDKDHILTAQIWLKDIARDFDGMNEVWESWFKSGTAPARATCQAQLARGDLLVEIIMTAALP